MAVLRILASTRVGWTARPRRSTPNAIDDGSDGSDRIRSTAMAGQPHPDARHNQIHLERGGSNRSRALASEYFWISAHRIAYSPSDLDGSRATDECSFLEH